MQAMKTALLLAVVVFALASPVAAQSERWRVDAAHSTAVLTLFSSLHPEQPLNYGVEMVAGEMLLDSRDFSKLSFTLNIFPAGEAEALLNPDGTWRVGAYAQLSRYTVLTFTSRPAERSADGTLRLTGDLTVTHVVRTAPSEGNVAYSGSRAAAVPEERTVSHEATLTLQKSTSEIAYGWRVGWMEIKAAGDLALEDAPGLWEWLADSVFPPVIEDRRCRMPSYSPGLRDYRGQVCTGTYVVAERPAELPRSNSTIDYTGAHYATPEKINQFRLSLDLKLREPESK